MAGALDKSTDLATEQAVSYVELNAAKAAQRELARQHRRDRAAVRRSVAGKERDCQLAALQRAFAQDRARLQTDIVAHRLKLGYVDRRKGLTKVGERLGKLARFVGEIAKATLKEAKPELLAALSSGGGGIALKAILKHRFKTIARRRLKEEALAKLTRGRSRAVLAEASDECHKPEVAASAAPEEREEQWDQGLNTGPFAVAGDFGYSEMHGRQAGALMRWEGIAGEQCTAFEAYNPHPMDPRNEELPPIHVNLRIDPEAERFVGVITGRTESDDLSEGGPAQGTFRVVMSGTVSDDLEGSGWQLKGENAYARLQYWAVRVCWDGKEASSATVKEKPGGGPAKVTGSISSGVSDWILELDVAFDNSAQSFTTSLTDIELGPVVWQSGTSN